MSALDQSAFPQSHLVLRSPMRRDRRLFVPDVHRRRRGMQELSVVRLFTHLATTSLVFLALITLVWIVSWTFQLMHAVHPFSNDVFRLFDSLEILLAYADAAVSGVVLLNGIWNYIVKVIKGDL